ncbi:hypothetical protein BV25DRAFT_1837381 [Artomyces pyxidatus]|uniref:Uncharacterized protein n=1 Tax=Artomyces pyxidatus TaxID=48021 RepID=A0ACB8T550_9AGAM|nr:hypothetical protein BV25DRAFT_1837381 [Artomyces pyxidatus]
MSFTILPNGTRLLHPTRDDPSRPSMIGRVVPLPSLLEFMETRRPMLHLREDCDPRRTKKAPVLHFGFGCSLQQLFRFSVDRGILDRDEYISLVDVKKYLEKVTNATLHIRHPISYEYDIMIARYSNYSMEHEQYEDEHERKVLQTIQRELKIEEQPALWYWNRNK